MKKRSWICAVVLVILFSAAFPARPVYASGAIGDVSEFNSLNGTGKYLGGAYRDNYYLDMEETGLLDTGYGILNSIANVLFSFIRWLAYAAVCVFFICFNLNLSTMFGSQINGIQEALNNSVFKPLFLLACGVAFIVLLGRLVRQDLMGALGQLAKIIGVVMLSILVVTQSSTVLDYTTGITKSVSVEIMAGVNSANGMATNVTSFAAQSAGILWQNLIHEPWITMEFDKDNPSDSEIEQFLTISPSDKDARKQLVADRDWDCFSKNRGAEKLGFMFLYLIPFAMKAVIYILIALVQLVFQLMAIFYVLMAPLILIISMVPGYERMLGVWLRKILESQVSILIITMIIGILIKFDQLIYEWARENSFGWLLAMVLQVALAVALFLNRNKLLGIMSTVQRGVATPRFAANRMRMGGNAYQTVIPQGIKYGKKAGAVARDAAKKTAGNAWRSKSNPKKTGAYGSAHPEDGEEGGTQRNGSIRPRISGADPGNGGRKRNGGDNMADPEGRPSSEERLMAGLHSKDRQAAMDRIQIPVSGHPANDAGPSGAQSGIRRPMLHSQDALMRQMETRLPERPAAQGQAPKAGENQKELLEKIQTQVQQEASKLRPKLRPEAEPGIEEKKADGGKEKQQTVTVKIKVEERTGNSADGKNRTQRTSPAGNAAREPQGNRTADSGSQKPVTAVKPGNGIQTEPEATGRGMPEQPVGRSMALERPGQTTGEAASMERLEWSVGRTASVERREEFNERAASMEKSEQPVRKSTAAERQEQTTGGYELMERSELPAGRSNPVDRPKQSVRGPAPMVRSKQASGRATPAEPEQREYYGRQAKHAGEKAERTRKSAPEEIRRG